jgi:Protein of unknown function (DUF3102)
MNMHGTLNNSDFNALAKQIAAEWRNAAASIIETGRLLIKAQKKVGYGHWGDFVAKLPFGDRTANRLMEIARHPVLSNPTHVSKLPPSWGTLHRLTSLPDRELKQFLSNGTVNSETQRKDVDQLCLQVRDEAQHRGDRITKALHTLVGFMKKYPDPKEFAEEASINHMGEGEHSVDLSDVAGLPAWLTKFQRACEAHARELRPAVGRGRQEA